jgi:hypothetical protein
MSQHALVYAGVRRERERAEQERAEQQRRR